VQEPSLGFREILQKIAGGKDLTVNEASLAMDAIIRGEATPAQIGALIMGLKLKGETIAEIVGCATKVQEVLKTIDLRQQQVVDVTGTGGSGTPTFNISTASAIVAAASGVKIAKQVSRAATAGQGSVEALLALGVNVEVGINTLQRCMNEVGLAFILTDQYHGVLARVEGPRREVGVRSIFNIVQPISNPAGAKRQVIGVFSEKLTDIVCQVLKKLGMQHSMVVFGLDGLDEITTSGKTKVAELYQGAIQSYYLSPEQFGIARSAASAYRAVTAEESALIINEVLNAHPGPARDVVVLNAAAAIRVGGFASSLEKAVEIAKRSIDSGRAKEVLERLIKLTQI
jgi:anthranilate phosphoribosyltransferase